MGPLAEDALPRPRGAGYRAMVERSAANGAGTPDNVGAVAALLVGPRARSFAGSDFPLGGGVTAAHW